MPKKVVVLEDDISLGELMRCMLAHGGFHALAATSCMDVQGHLSGGGVAALVADLMLGANGCSGTDVALRALITDPAIRILFISGTPFGDWSTADRDNAAALPEGSFDFLAKPFTPAIFLGTLAALLRAPAEPPPAGICCPEYAGCLDVSPPTLAQVMAARSARRVGRTHSAMPCR